MQKTDAGTVTRPTYAANQYPTNGLLIESDQVSLVIGGSRVASFSDVGLIDSSTTIPTVLDYGCVGDGTTDDTTNFQAALTACSGKALRVPAGYTFSVGPLTLPSIHLIVDGTVKAKVLAVTTWISATSVNDVTISGPGCFDANVANQAQDAITSLVLSSVDRAKLLGVRFVYQHRGVDWLNNTRTCVDFLAQGCVFDGSQYDDEVYASNAITIRGQRAKVIGNSIVMPDQSGYTGGQSAVGIVVNGVASYPVYGTIIKGNEFSYGYTGIATDYAPGTIIEGNLFRSIRTAGVSQGTYVDNSSHGTLVRGNTFVDCVYRVSLFKNSDYCVCDGNSYHWTGDVPNTAGHAAITMTTGADYGIVSNNAVYNFRTSSASMSDAPCAIVLGGPTTPATECLCFGNQINCATGAGGLIPSGIRTEGSKHKVFNNSLVLSTNATAFRIPSGSYQDNLFWGNTVSVSGASAKIYNDSGTGAGNLLGPVFQIGSVADTVSAGSVRLQDALPAVKSDSSTSVTVLAADSGTLYANRGAAGTATYSLPAATIGLEYRFMRVEAQTLRIDPNGTEVFTDAADSDSGAGKYLSLDTLGAYVHLKCLVTGKWRIVRTQGTTTYEA